MSKNKIEGYSCVVCGTESSSRTILAKDNRYGNSGVFSYQRCRACGTLSQFPVPTEEVIASYYPAEGYYAFAPSKIGWPTGGRGDGLRLALRAKGYEFTVKTSGSAIFWKFYYQLFLNTVEYMPEKGWGTRYLDFGCGSNGTVGLMSALGWQASGLEPSREAVSAGQRIGLDIQQGTALNHPWEPETFDFIYSHHSFEHVPDPLATLKGLTMLLRPGGRLLIVQPDASGCCAHFGRYWGGLAAPVHIHLHTAKSMQILASQSGLEIEYQKTKDNPHDVISTFLFLMGFSLAKPHILFMTLATRAVTPVLKAVARVGLGCDLVTLFHKTPV